MKSEIHIISKSGSGMESRLSIGNDTYDVQTEDLGVSKRSIVTRIYRRGEIVHSATSDYTHLLRLDNPREKISTLMENQHRSVTDLFFRDRKELDQTKNRHASEIRRLLNKNDVNGALELVRNALLIFPSDLFFMSYCGYLVSVVEKNHREGIRLCEEAIAALRRSLPDDLEFFYPLFYLNLGKAYMSAGRRKQAMDAFRKGLKYKSRDSDLLAELRRFGARKQPVVSFLNRANPVNIFLGKLRHRIRSRQAVESPM